MSHHCTEFTLAKIDFNKKYFVLFNKFALSQLIAKLGYSHGSQKYHKIMLTLHDSRYEGGFDI